VLSRTISIDNCSSSDQFSLSTKLSVQCSPHFTASSNTTFTPYATPPALFTLNLIIVTRCIIRLVFHNRCSSAVTISRSSAS